MTTRILSFRVRRIADSSGDVEPAVPTRCCRMAISNRVAQVHLTMPFVAAVVQDCPVVFDRDRTLDKIGVLTTQAAKTGARLVVFPEAFVSSYPKGLDFGARVGGRTHPGPPVFPALLRQRG